MSDLEQVLEGIEGAESLVRRLRKFTKGTFSQFFNQPTNISMDKPFLAFGIRDMEDEFDTISYNMQLWGNALSETAAEFGDIGKSFIKYGPWLWIGAAGLGIMLLAWRSGGAVKSLARRAKSGF